MNMGPEHEMPAAICVNCGHNINGAFGITTDDNDSDVRPGTGDFTLCIVCGHLQVFAEDMSLREPTDEEKKEIAGAESLIAASRALDLLRQEHPDAKPDPAKSDDGCDGGGHKKSSD